MEGSFEVQSLIYLEGLRKIMKHLSKASWPPGQDLNLGPRYEGILLTTWP
jgi:hypothetical protein